MAFKLQQLQLSFLCQWP